MPSLLEIGRRYLTLQTDVIYTLPILVLMPHSRCNCRCVMCDIWKANRNGKEITPAQLAPHLDDLRRLNVQWVTLSGGEALMHSNLWTLCEQMKQLKIRLSLLSTGLLLEKHAADVVRWCDEVIVSLDGDRETHDEIRNIPRAYERLVAGVDALRRQNVAYPVSGRCVIQRRNFLKMGQIVDAARAIGLDSISFLGADVSSTAFNRPQGWESERVADVALSREETALFAKVVEETIEHYASDFANGFIVESPQKLRRIVHYYEALNGDTDLPEVRCNAPWVSAVIESDGTVRPCFFHQALGNLDDRSLEAIINSSQAISFRRDLDMQANPICRRCVCSLHLPPTGSVDS